MSTQAVFSHQILAGVHCLVPTDQDGLDVIPGVKVGKQFLLEISTPRNPRHHRMLFLLFKTIIDGGAWEGDVDSLLIYVKYGTNLCDPVIDHMGQVQYVPRSIAFASMDQTGFSAWFDRAVYFLAHRLLGSTGDEWMKVRDRIIEIVDGRFASQANHLDRGKAA